MEKKKFNKKRSSGKPTRSTLRQAQGDTYRKGDKNRKEITISRSKDKANAEGKEDKKLAKLVKYNQKRNFEKTAEPKGEVKKSKGDLIFMVQKHDASHLHFDFRIELDGVLKSWAVPKGPPLDSSTRHLAMMVEDHPYDYRTFEGTIPEGNYGAGTVMLWDEGTYHSLYSEDRAETEKIIREQIKKGSIKLVLNGKKLKGAFAFVRFKRAGDNAWLMIKDKDQYSGRKISNIDLSVKTGRTLDEISKSSKNQISKVKFDDEPVAEVEEEKQPEIKLQKNVEKITPMLSTLVDEPFSNEDWIYEIKWDGYRAIANIKKGDVTLSSRNHQILNKDYEPVVEDLEKIKDSMILDGEIVVIDKDGKSGFQLLQNYRRTDEGNLVYYVFDILKYKNKDLTKLPLLERKKILKEVLPKLPNVKISDYIEEKGIEFYEVAKKQELEGIIAKKKDSTYHQGIRSNDWVKIKITQGQEVVIGGYTHPEGQRKEFGSLLIGIFDADGEFQYVGHAGSGFDEKTLKKVKETLDKYKTAESPFVDTPRMNNVAQWVKPRIIAEVKFHGWTENNMMRQAIFLGLREDKRPKRIKKEVPKETKNVVKKEFAILTHGDKIYWPKVGYTKKDLFEYYSNVSDLILPYLKDRAETLNRFPHGVEGESFFQKNFEDPPEFAETVEIESESNGRDTQYLVCNNKETLLYMANLGCIEINPWNSRIHSLNTPDYLIFDLDADPKYFDNLITVTNALRELLEDIGIEGYPKTSGKRGLHVNIPLKAKYDFEQVRTFAQIVSVILENRMPEIINLERNPDKRKNKVYIDYLQNRKGQTTATAYSARPSEYATVSTPLKWGEVNKKLKPRDFDIKSVIKRFDKVGDLWRGVLGRGVDLSKALKGLENYK